ncbi:anti-sigma regulatory factor (Ser/Thr protein kinase) [Thermocatellispora tengchongensis]|uniref:Anti-sigma regulatory factor (Ser/Thr protein kinase) n=1 Tax=Thermocatellispora tengchongensis TaxID=1073253 RepID=A0A840P117_9ACTN|nr:ATP-binding protein [Thermocatellispora tengchongensis]MBB5134944.1 anti-sigma regulatory factor (Ser/Thr protein kinase) [Thermocatellispora tengchongensis]
MDLAPHPEWPITYDLAEMRARVAGYALQRGMPLERVEALVLATNEAITNVLEHGGGKGAVACRTDATGITVEIVDYAGALKPAHLNGRPTDWTTRGLGLWVIRQLCDETEVDNPHGNSRLRLHMRYDG